MSPCLSFSVAMTKRQAVNLRAPLTTAVRKREGGGRGRQERWEEEGEKWEGGREGGGREGGRERRRREGGREGGREGHTACDVRRTPKDDIFVEESCSECS